MSMNARSIAKQLEQAEIDAAKAEWLRKNKITILGVEEKAAEYTTTERHKAKTFKDVIDGLHF